MSDTVVSGPRVTVLAILLEFDVWDMARKWAYANSYGILDGLKSAGCDVVVLPSLYMKDAPDASPWLAARDAILEGRTFDQVWVWTTHGHYDADIWLWLETIAPVRVGVLMESLTYDQADITEIPALAGRQTKVYKQLRHMTHVITGDDTEVAMIGADVERPTRLYLPMLPAALLAAPMPPTFPSAVFLGTLYGKRKDFLRANTPGAFVKILASPEDGTEIPSLFDKITASHLDRLRQHGGNAAFAESYVQDVSGIRIEVVRRTLALYNMCLAGIALPAMFKGVTGRVVEMMAASTPVLMPSPRGRPAPPLLVDGENVLCYDPDIPGDLERVTQRLTNEPNLRDRLVSQARDTFERDLCSEVQIARILDWISVTSR